MKHFFLLISFCLCLSCSEKKTAHFITEKFINARMMRYEKNPDIIEIDQKDIDHTLYSEKNDCIKNIHYIPCFSKEPIGTFDEVTVYNDRIIVLDAFTTQKVYIFDMSGNMINIIDKKGQGPEEYFGLLDMSISKKDSMIVLNDRTCRTMHYYSLDGKFVKKTKASPGFYLETNDGKMFNWVNYGQSFSLNIEDNYHLTISIDDSILYRGFPYYPLQEYVAPSNGLQYNSKGELLLNITPNDTVYQIINDSTCMAKYVIKQKKSLWNRRNENLPNKQQRDLVTKENYTYFRGPVWETDNHIFYRVDFGEYTDDYYITPATYLYDKRQKKSYNFKDPKLGDGHIVPSNALPVPIAIMGNYFIGIHQSHEVELMMEIAKLEGCPFVYENEELRNILKDEKNKDMEFLLVMYEFK